MVEPTHREDLKTTAPHKGFCGSFENQHRVGILLSKKASIVEERVRSSASVEAGTKGVCANLEINQGPFGFVGLRALGGVLGLPLVPTFLSSWRVGDCEQS